MRPQTLNPVFPGYALLRRDRPGGGGGGLAILITHDIEFTPIDVDGIIDGDLQFELQAVNVHLRHQTFAVFNVYIPPSSSCTPGYLPDFDAFLDDVAGDAIVLGDFNAHDGGWFSALSDARGEALISAIEGSDFAILNEDFPTRHASNGSSSPDVSLISAHLSNLFSWSVPLLLRLVIWRSQRGRPR